MQQRKTPTYDINDLLTLMGCLRDRVWGCPWDKKQTFKSLVPSTIEEVYELVDAIEHSESEQISEELGDVLFQVIFYSQLGQERDEFSFAYIVDQLTQKLLRRHPHVFPDGTLSSFSRTSQDRLTNEAEIKKQWEIIKQQERKNKELFSLLDDIPQALPALTRSQKIQKRASTVGFDWANVDGVMDKVDEEIAELKDALQEEDSNKIKEELGDLLFSVVNLCRFLSVDAELALRQSNKKFERRFSYIEEQSKKYNTPLNESNRQIMNQFWQEAKEKE